MNKMKFVNCCWEKINVRSCFPFAENEFYYVIIGKAQNIDADMGTDNIKTQRGTGILISHLTSLSWCITRNFRLFRLWNPSKSSIIKSKKKKNMSVKERGLKKQWTMGLCHCFLIDKSLLSTCPRKTDEKRNSRSFRIFETVQKYDVRGYMHRDFIRHL